MGIADVIPGISGGTLALMLGIYERLIASIKSISPQVILALLKNIQFWDPTKRRHFIQSLNEFNAFSHYSRTRYYFCSIRSLQVLFLI